MKKKKIEEMEIRTLLLSRNKKIRTLFINLQQFSLNFYEQKNYKKC